MSLVNALLVRWSRGWRTVEDAGSIATHGRYEGFLSLANAQSTAEVDRVATSILGVWAQPTVTTTMGVEPTGTGDVPFADWDVADFVTAQTEDGPDDVQVVSLSVTENVDGRVQFVPELRHARDLYEDRIERWLSRVGNGTLGGASSSATPASAGSASGSSDGMSPASRSDPVQAPIDPPFSLPGDLITDSSPRYTPRRNTTLVEVYVTLDTAGTSNTVLTLYKNGSSIGTATLGSGVHSLLITPNAAFNETDYLTMAVTTVGTGSPKNLTAQPEFRP